MEISTIPNFILIDDDSLSSFICSKIIKRTFPDTDVRVFNSSDEALDHVSTLLDDPLTPPFCLFTDMNMPGTNGLELLGRVSDLPTFHKDRVMAYMLSASYDFMDVSSGHPLLSAYVRKPLTTEKLQIIFRNYILENRITA